VRGSFAGSVMLALIMTAAASAPEAKAAASDDRFAQLFQQLLHDPTNVDLNLRYADAAVKKGDLEAAITALERLLFYDPGLPQVRLQLGLIYTELGSYETARSYLAPLAADGAVPPDLHRQASAALAALDALSSPNQFGGLAFFGIQAQSNPGAAAGSPVFVTTGTLPRSPITQLTEGADASGVIQANATDLYDLENPAGDALETDAQVYGSRFIAQHALNTAQVQGTFGPRLGLSRIGDDEGTVRPYALLDYVGLAGTTYYRGYGGGVDLHQKLGDGGNELTAGFSTEQANYHPTQNYPTARLLNGSFDRYSIADVAPLTDALSLTVTGLYTRQSTRAAYYSNDDYSAAAALAATYPPPPFLEGAGAWQTAFSAGGHYISFDGPDASVKAGIKQADWRWQFSLTQTVPLSDNLALAAQLYRDILSSNIGNYSYHNLSFLMGAQLTF
jgi:tetratricopeptide (TPR) repeat protein